MAAGGPGLAATAGSCGGTVQLVFQLSDQGNDLGQITLPFNLGQPGHPLQEEFEAMMPPDLPPAWSSMVPGGGATWTTTSNSPPNAVPPEVPDEPGDPVLPIGPPNTSVFAPALAGMGQSFLYSPLFIVINAQAQLYFRHAFAMSNTYDGGILEIAVGTQPFQDIVLAGGAFVQHGYNAVLNDRNPLGPRPGWSGDSGGRTRC